MSERDWADQVLGKIDGAVELLHDRAVVPVLTAVRAVVFGIIIAFMGLAALVLLSIALVRIVANYVPANVWAADAIVGGVFLLIGLFLWVQRKSKS